MSTDPVTPVEDRPGRIELVRQSERTRVTRVFLSEHTVIRKEPLGPDAQRRLRQEASMLERLRGVVGVAQLADGPRYPGSIVLQDAGRVSLAELAKPLAADALLAVAIVLSRAVAGMHRSGVLHRDISPANIVAAGDGAPCLVDFALATPVAEIRPEFTHHSEILGTLAYLAPEQTGRTGRSVDQRSDLYALGATLYELATGGPPFGAGDPLRLIHEHLAKRAVPPAEVNPVVPVALSEIVMHLLEKEPDSRYQTADGLLHDLEQLRGASGERPTVLRVGENDFAMRLLPPSRLAGRDDEVAALRGAFDDAVVGRCRGVFVSGPAGVGKTALVDELRAVVTGRDGWFVTGKFDEYRRDLEFQAGWQAFRALGRLLLAEPEEELSTLRGRIIQAVGANASLLTAVVPEFATLLAVPPEPGDPLTAQVRVGRACAQLLRAVASRERPVVLCMDDMQWAGGTPLGFVDQVLSEKPMDGVFFVGTYREDELTPGHPLAAPLSRWRERSTVRELRLVNLPVSASITMLAEMLHVERDAAAKLAAVIEPQTGGNPYGTVELLGALRRDGMLTATPAGWRWEEASVRAHLSDAWTHRFPAARVAAMPPPVRQMVVAMACLGGRAEMSLLQAATGAAAEEVEQALAPALEDGLLVMEPGAHDAVRFRHDRIRETILDGLKPERRRILQLALARRLANVPDLYAVAAEQYLPVADAVEDPAERRQTVGLLRRAAEQARLVGNYTLVNALLSAALPLIESGDTTTRVQVHNARYAAFYSLRRFEEADEEYRTIDALCSSPVERADATAVQVRSLTHRNRLADAVALGAQALCECGIPVPTADRLGVEIDRTFGKLYDWLEHTQAADDLARPEVTDPLLCAASGLIDAMLPAAFFAGDLTTHGWLTLEALRIFVDHGPARTLVGPASQITWAAMNLRGDPAAGYRAVQRILRVGEQRGYEPGTSEARFLFALQSCWFEPIEIGVQAVQRAREGLIAGGDLAHAGYTYHLASAGLLDCAQTLEGCVAEVQSGLAFARRTGGERSGQWLDTYDSLAAVLRGDRMAAAKEAVPADRYESPVALFHAHVNQAVAAAIFGDLNDLSRHTAAAMTLLPAAVGLYPTAAAHVLRGLALAGQARMTDGPERAELLSELDEVTRWLAARAADAPDNFLHLLRLVEAERAWSAGDFRAAAVAVDAALRAASQRQRPWHRALIAERAAQLYLGQGLEHLAYDLLAQARRDYLAWGATAKVNQLDWSYPTLRPQRDTIGAGADDQQHDDPHQRFAVSTGTLDLLGILSASQALSSQTSVDGLHARVVEILSAMTGATDVHLALWREDSEVWLVPTADRASATVSVNRAVEGTVPMSVLRYAQRTREPLVVVDAAGDDRFARDPYFADIACCSLLVVPVLSRGTLRAVLLLENRLIRGAFTPGRLDAVKLIAAQLAVSLDNAQLYTEFRRIADEQAALGRVATLVARGVSPAEIFGAVSDEVSRLFDAEAGIARFEPDGSGLVFVGLSRGIKAISVGTRWQLEDFLASTEVHRTGRPARSERGGWQNAAGPAAEALRQNDPVSMVAAPITVDSNLWGVITVAEMRSPLPLSAEERVANFTELVGTAIANAESRAELAASRARIIAAADEARRRIERDLHDGAQQRLVTLAVMLRRAQAKIPAGLGELSAEMTRVNDGMTTAVQELRELSRGIHPSVLTEGGLSPALNALARHSTVPVELDVGVEQRLPEHVEVAAYYTVSESITNAAKHAHAAGVRVSIRVEDGVLLVSIRDDGVGGADVGRGSGLTGLKDRIEALGGEIHIVSPPGGGTDIEVQIPTVAIAARTD